MLVSFVHMPLLWPLLVSHFSKSGSFSEALMGDLFSEAFMGDSSILIGFLLSKRRKTFKLPKYQMSGYLVLENVRAHFILTK